MKQKEGDEMSEPIEIPAELQQWAEPFFDYNSETYNPLAVLERIAKLEAQVQQLHSEEAIITAFWTVWDSRRYGNGMGNAVIYELLATLKAQRAALAATEEKP